MSRIDQLYRRLLLTKFFTKGWGKPDNLKRLFEFRKIISNREKCQQLVASDYPIFIDKEYKDGDCRILEGHFKSPFIDHLPGIMPKEVETASFQMILPLQWRYTSLKPVCIHLAGTGDHFFWRRRLLTARPLLKESGIASIMLENPYYGSRKPKSQIRSSLHNVSDLFVMGGALVLESMALLHWCEREGWGPLGISGISMGGHMASSVAAVWTKPVSLIPILSWTTASTCFTQGVMSGAIPWATLQEQFFENSVFQEEISKLITSPERTNGNAYNMGQQFAKHYAQDVSQLENYHLETLQSEAEQLSVPLHITAHPDVGSSYKCEDNDSSVNKNHINEGNTKKCSSTSNVTHLQKPASSFRLNEDIEHPTEKKTSNQASTTSLQSTIVKTSPSHHSDLEVDKNSNSFVTAESPSQITDTGSREESSRLSRLRQVKQALTLNYAKTKQFQQWKVSSGNKSEKKTLSLSHAQAKSKLTSRQSKKQLASDSEKLKNLQRESYDFMVGVMDECTHLGNFSVPVDPELIIIVSASQDAYVPKKGVLGLDQLWPGCEVRYIDQGHVGAVVLHQAEFRKAIRDSFDKQIKKYYPEHVRTAKSPQYILKKRKTS